jgi:hypothetical protein
LANSRVGSIRRSHLLVALLVLLNVPLLSVALAASAAPLATPTTAAYLLSGNLGRDVGPSHRVSSFTTTGDPGQPLHHCQAGNEPGPRDNALIELRVGPAAVHQVHGRPHQSP